MELKEYNLLIIDLLLLQLNLQICNKSKSGDPQLNPVIFLCNTSFSSFSNRPRPAYKTCEHGQSHAAMATSGGTAKPARRLLVCVCGCNGVCSGSRAAASGRRRSGSGCVCARMVVAGRASASFSGVCVRALDGDKQATWRCGEGSGTLACRLKPRAFYRQVLGLGNWAGGASEVEPQSAR